MSKATELTGVKELVHTKSDNVFADSLTIALKFEKQHKDVIRKIEKLTNQDKKFGVKVRQSFYKDEYGRKQKMYQMDRDAFVFLCTKFTGKKVQEWQWQFIEAFNTMEAMLREKNSHEWQIARQKGIQIRKGLGDTLSQFVEYAKKQGSTKATFYYSNVTRETYKALHFIAGREKIPSTFRDTLNNFDLASLQMAEYVAQGALHEGMIKQMYYKDIYQLVKEKVLIFASSIAIARVTKEIK